MIKIKMFKKQLQILLLTFLVHTGVYGQSYALDFDGLIDEVAVWNEALTAAEITTLYNSGIGLDAASNSGNYASASNLVAYYKMNEGTGTTIADASGNVNTGTLSNMDAADWVAGVSMVAAINPFITTWETNASNTITIPLIQGGYDFSIDWGDGTIETKTGSPGNISHTYTTAGIYTVSITPNITTGFPRIYVNNFGNRNLLKTVESWGSGIWGTGVDRSFFGAANLEINATDTPNFSQTTNFQSMFLNCTSLTGTNGFANWTLNTNSGASISFESMFYRATAFNGTISNWDVSKVTNMSSMFVVASSFNQDLSNWDVSSVTNMSYMFHSSPFNSPLNWGVNTGNVTSMVGMFHSNGSFNQDISGWDVSSVTNMYQMFYRSGFNSDLNSWDVSSLTNAEYMFQENSVFNGTVSNWQFTTDTSKNISMANMFKSARAFNQNISGWDVTRVTNMSNMFNGASVFNTPLNWGIKTGNVTNMAGMFGNTVFNQDISGWDVSKVTNMSGMFYRAIAFNGTISNWDVSKVTNMSSMFVVASSFNQDLSNWDVSSVTNMSYMFHSSPFNSPLNWGVNTGNVTSMDGMFHSNGSFNQDISGWDVSSVTNMDSMFAYANAFNSPLNWGIKTGNVANMNNMFRQAPLFNQDINGWDVSKVTTTVLMFYQANSFNQDLNSWDVSSLTNPSRMFESCSSFNGNISSWQFTTDPAKSINMSSMFLSATSFNQNISAWNISRVTNLINFLNGGKLSRENYDALLLGWSTLDAGETQIPTGLNAHFGSSKYSNTSTVVTARDTELISNKGWTITDGGIDSDFTLPLIASNSLALDNTTISITFSEVVYRTNVGSGALEITDFLFAINGGTATPSSTTPISITSTNNLTFVLGIGLTGTPNGNEILTVTPVLNAVFDASGNAAATTQTNNTANLNDLSPPVITGPDSTTGSSSSISISENHTSGFSFTANKPVTWTLGNLNDETLFAIDSSGSLTFINAPDYEAPLSSTSSNIYLVEVIATDGSSRVSIQTLTITILDVPPTIFGTFNAINKYYFSGTHTIIAPSTNNSNPITYTSDNTTVATITGTIITFTGVGTANIIATQASDANYESSSVSALLTVVSENVVSKYGGISPTNPNYVDRHGKIGGANAVSKNGALLQVIPPFSGGTFDGFTYSLVTSETGRVWLDRNLGASQVATSSSDALSFGDLYQWGRGTDGHEKRTSTNINMVSTTDTPGHSFFINANSFNWQSPVNTNLWQGVNGTNNPCPNGFRVPTIEELEAERNLWGSQNAAGAIASSLKLPLAGRRHTNGIIYSVGSNGMYRTTTSLILNITSTTAARAGDERIDGFCVRCIKD